LLQSSSRKSRKVVSPVHWISHRTRMARLLRLFL
jgi:hypothetical protein